MEKSKFNLSYLIIIAICLSFICVGCSAKYEYSSTTNNVEIYNSIEESSDYIDCFEYSTEHADYYFETTLKDKQKDAFVDTAEQILTDYPTDKVKFIVGTSLHTAYVSKVRNAKNTSNRIIDTVYFNINDLSSINLLVELNAKRYGENIPYGLLYAYSYGQCKDSKYKLPEALKDSKLKETVDNNKDIADLNTFVFLSSFTSENEKSAAQTLSIKLYEKIGLQKLQEIIEDNSVKECQDILEFYVKSICFENNIIPQLKIGLEGFDCYHTQKYIVAENADLKVRVFVDAEFKPTSNETYLDNYSNLKERLEEAIVSFVRVNDFVENVSPLPVDIYMKSDIKRGWADGATGCVNLNEFIYLTHEYCHIAMLPNKYSKKTKHWTLEAIASYCGAFLGEQESYFIINNCIDFLGKNNVADKAYSLFDKYPPKSRADFWDILGYSEESIYPNYIMDDSTWVLDQFIAPSFCNYLIDTYGKQKLMELCGTSYSTEMSIYGKTFEQLRSDWFTFLQSKYE